MSRRRENPPHRVLGIAADADAAAIKRAFRKLAMALHPDRNPDPEAAERFKAARAAHDAMMAALLDDEAAAEFSDDAPDPAPTEPTPHRGEDWRRDLELTLEEAAFGCRKTLTLACFIPCATCDGSGEYGASRSSLCAHCQGSGRLREGGALIRCPLCAGRGFSTSRICPDCAGSGRHDASRHLQVHVPAGVAAGSELRLAGQGGSAPEGGEPGHLLLRVTLAAHPDYQVSGRDLIRPQPINILRWLAGGTVDLSWLDGTPLRIALSPATSLHGARQVIAGRGLPGHRGQAAGELVIDWQPFVPILDARTLTLLDAAAGQADSA